jgi:hypothetical protein
LVKIKNPWEMEILINQIKGQVLFKGKINAKLGWVHLKIFSRTTQPEELKFR